MISASVIGVTLTVLKIIGFVLLGIIALALLIALEILFVPIRYKVKAKAEASGGEKNFSGFARASWLLHILNFSVKMDGQDMIMTFRVFGIPVKKEIKNKDKEKVSSSNPKLSSDEIEEIEKEIDEIEKEIDFEPIFSRKANIEEADIIDIISDNRTNSDILDDIYEEIEEDRTRADERIVEADSKTANEKKGFFTKIKEKIKSFINLVKSIVSFIISIPKKILSLVSKIKEGIILGEEKLQKFEDFINDKENREAFELAKKELFFLLKHIKPTKIVGRINFGLDDPSWTGKILGLYYSIFPVSPKKFSLTAEFDKKIFEGNIMMRGHIRLNHILTSFLRIKKNDRLKKLIDGHK